MSAKAKKPAKVTYSNIKIDRDVYGALFEYCTDNGLVIKRFAQNAIVEKLSTLTRKKK